MIEGGYVVGERRGRIEILPGEQWRPVVGYDGAFEKRYIVSNMGRVASLNWCGVDGFLSLMSQTDDTKGYPKVKFTDAVGRERTCAVHKLVALAFIPNPDGKPVVNHIDENPHNNVASNLEWVTNSENIRHNNGHIRRAETRCRAVVACDTHGVKQMRFRSACDAVRQLGSGKTAGGRLVTKACAHGGGGYAYGYYWWYADEIDEA